MSNPLAYVLRTPSERIFTEDHSSPRSSEEPSNLELVLVRQRKPQPKSSASATRLVSPPHGGNLLTLVDRDPKSSLALEAATWIILNSPDGPEVAKAVDVIRHEHVRSKDLAYLCHQLEDSRHRSAEKLIQAVLEANPHAEVQGHACFSLAMIVKLRAMEGTEAHARELAADEADRLLERVRSEFSGVQSDGVKLEARAKPEVFELPHLRVGKVAPDIDGTDTGGRVFHLSEYRGKVILVIFSTRTCSSCVAMYPQLRGLLERWRTTPFATRSILGRNVTSVKWSGMSPMAPTSSSRWVMPFSTRPPQVCLQALRLGPSWDSGFRLLLTAEHGRSYRLQGCSSPD